MKNPEEHKKLLTQITELEKNSVNYFDVEKEFFLIDSNNLAEIKTKLYGYTIQATGIYENDDLTEDAAKNLDGRGCYVYVEARDGKITIKQDLNGCWGIYLFRHGDYFALSNSFFRLLDHIKFKYPLTVNRDYCHQLLTNGLVSHAHLETAVNEIQLVERNAIVHIDKVTKSLELELIDYREHTIPLDSAEGIAILDSWIEFWSGVLRGIAQHTQFLKADLSGGFDTRMALTPLLNSGIDLSKVRIYSIKSELHTYKEDYAIASQIADRYNFKLNQNFSAQQDFLNYSLNDSLNIDFYIRQTIHKSWSILKSRKDINKTYSLSGYGGEIIRGYWHKDPLKFINSQCGEMRQYSTALSREMSSSIKKMIDSAFRNICDKYNIKDSNSQDIPQYFYQETRCRHHFGKFSLGSYFANEIVLSPALDPEIRTIRLCNSECPDPKLLMALLFARHAPDLLTFPFDSKRFIAPETIEYAKKINERFPICHKKAENLNGGGQKFYLQPRDLQAEKILAEGSNNPNIPISLLLTCLKAMFESSRTYGLFTTYFDEVLYRYAATYYETHVFGRIDYIIGVVGVTRALEDVEISQRNHPLYQDTKRFLTEDFALVHDDDNAQIVNNFKRYFTARVDIKLMKSEGDFQIVDVSDDKANVSKPGWLQKGGIGYQIQSYVGTLNFVAKSSVDGKISLSLRGVDVRTPEDKSKRIPYWIDYTKLIVNGKTIFDTLTPAWHDKSYRHVIDVKAGEEIKIQVEWLPHRSDV